MDGEGTRISLQRSEMMQIRLSEPIVVGMKKMMSMTSKDPEDCAVPAGRRMGRAQYHRGEDRLKYLDVIRIFAIRPQVTTPTLSTNNSQRLLEG